MQSAEGPYLGRSCGGNVLLTERSGDREDAGAAVSDQQVNAGSPRYPVDRYLVERSNKLEMVNITDDIWNAEPALRPEDEIVLRKLHDMLQSTTDDLKLLSGELSKYHEPGVHVKTLPTPLDEDFNEKVHIEELVNAKFHGYNVVYKSQPTPASLQGGKINDINKSHPQKYKKVNDASVQVNGTPIFRKAARNNNLTVSRTKTIQINENVNAAIGGNEKNSWKQEEKVNKPTIAYKELSFRYLEPNIKVTSPRHLQVQTMPSVNIRGELKEQKVLQLNIEPETINNDEKEVTKSNIAVVSIQHEPITKSKAVPIENLNQAQYPTVPTQICSKQPTRKFSKISSYGSSEDDSHKINSTHAAVSKIRSYKDLKAVIKPPPRQYSENIKNTRKNSKKESAKHSNTNLDTWKRKLDAVYGCTRSSAKSKIVKPDNKIKKIQTKPCSPSCSQTIENRNNLNNAEYIPYSKLTLGGARVSDIEKELSNISNRNDVTLGPILNKILSRENSFHNESPRFNKSDQSPKILTTSDENLLQEVLDIERQVTKTLTKNNTEHSATINKHQPLNDDDGGQDSYADDFEDEKSDYSAHTEKEDLLSNDACAGGNDLGKSHDTDSENKSFRGDGKNVNVQNKTYTKTMNLSFKKDVDVFEFIPNIDTQDTGTQSNTVQKISLKETQTSPRNDKCNMQPIHNDLWPSIDPKGEVEKLFQLEKDFIKKLIVDEYGDILEKNLNKPSTSKDNQSNDDKNLTASQKNTQTSPAHVKSVMTSPTRTKTRTTSPFALSLTVNQQTSPLSIQEDTKINVDDGDHLGISINLSSPRFSLRLPQTSCEVLSNRGSHAQYNRNDTKTRPRETRLTTKNAFSSSSSADGDYSSSDISSLGEVRFKLKRFQRQQVRTLSELSSATSVSRYSSDISDAIVPLRSEGEISLGQVRRKKQHKNIKSNGEASMGRLY